MRASFKQTYHTKIIKTTFQICAQEGTTKETLTGLFARLPSGAVLRQWWDDESDLVLEFEVLAEEPPAAPPEGSCPT